MAHTRRQDRTSPRVAVGAIALAAASCASIEAGRPIDHPEAIAPRPAGGAPVRVFQGAPDDVFWVTHDEVVDRVITSGARLVVSSGGEVRSSAWETDLGSRGEALVGALALPPRLGGGFVHWSRSRLYRSSDFTGALTPIDGPDLTVRGVRLGLRGALVVIDGGVRELLPGATAPTPLAEPVIQDLVALDDGRALRLDLLGRAELTGDGGASWLDLAPLAGTAIRGIAVDDRDLLIETWQGRFRVGAAGALTPADASALAGVDPFRSFQPVWPGTRAAEREDWPWGLRDASPLEAAVFSGAALPDGTALGVIQSMVVRVDLRTGAPRAFSTEWIPTGLQCQPLPDGDGALLACGWERYQGDGGYVMRSAGGGPPVIERAFTDEGSFVADDDGALGFIGSCRVEPRPFDPEEPGRFERERSPQIAPVICVRRAPSDPARPAEWVERRVELDVGESLLAWIPRRDGTATALIAPGSPLPEVERGAPPLHDRGGVRVVLVPREIAGFSFARPSWQPSMRGSPTVLDRRFAAREGGAIDGWLGPSTDGYASTVVGVTLSPEGRPTLHDLPPTPAAMVVTGDHGVAITRDGALYQTVDHGRRWTAAGPSPIPVSAFAGGGCSALGCAMGPFVRLGWGDGAVATQISEGPAKPAATPRGSPRLICAPRGAPEPRRAPPATPPSLRQTVLTGYGDTLEIVRDPGVSEPPPPPSLPGMGRPILPTPILPTPIPPTPIAAPTSRPSAAPLRRPSAVLRTHTLIYRAPFDPSAAPLRLNATDAALVLQRRAAVTPLLAANGEVGLLVAADSRELVIRGDHLTTLPVFEPRRWAWNDGVASGGLLLPSGHALALGELRRRLTLEEHGSTPPSPPLFLGAEREVSRRRPITVGRRDDGEVGLLIFDGPSPAIVGVVAVDRRSGSLGPAVRLAPWSSLIPSGDPRCAADPAAYEALVLFDPSAWLDLDAAALPGVSFAKQGMARVRWGKERVCLLALDVGAIDGRRRGDSARGLSLVARWGGAILRADPRAETLDAALRAPDLRQPLTCAIAPPRP